MLRVKKFGVNTYGENVAFLSARCRVYNPENFTSLNKIEVEAADPHDGLRRIMAVLNIVESGELLEPDLLGLSVSAFADLGVPEGTPVTIKPAAPPRSLDSVRRKIAGQTLSAAEIEEIILDLAKHRYSKMEIAAFLVASAAFITNDEVLAMTKAMAEVGTQLKWNLPMVVDKHCVGGIPGNRTSPIVVAIVAAHGLPIPKTSSRAITSPAGTADTMEMLANVNVSTERMQAIVRELNGCLVWGGHANLSPADDIMITVERPLAIDTPEQLVASILSKKVAAGATHLVVDMPVGPTAKIRGADQAAKLRKLFEYVGTSLGLNIKVIVTDGSQPIGRGIGPALEARDVMAVLRNDPGAPADLRDRALLLAAHVLEFDPALRGGAGAARAAELLSSGQALARFERIIAAQGATPLSAALGSHVKDVLASADGVVATIDCYRIARIARLAGAPMSPGAGIDLFKKVGDAVRRGAPLYRIYAAVQTDFTLATDMAREGSGYSLG